MYVPILSQKSADATSFMPDTPRRGFQEPALSPAEGWIPRPSKSTASQGRRTGVSPYTRARIILWLAPSPAYWFWRIYSSFSWKLPSLRTVWSKDSSCQTGRWFPAAIHATRRNTFDLLEDRRQGWASLGRPAAGEQEMYVIGHDHCGLEVDSLTVVI